MLHARFDKWFPAVPTVLNRPTHAPSQHTLSTATPLTCAGLGVVLESQVVTSRAVADRLSTNDLLTTAQGWFRAAAPVGLLCALLYVLASAVVSSQLPERGLASAEKAPINVGAIGHRCAGPAISILAAAFLDQALVDVCRKAAGGSSVAGLQRADRSSSVPVPPSWRDYESISATASL